MINTGYISLITEGSGGGFDINGNPIATTKVNSVYFPCNHATVRREYVLLLDGQATQAKYIVYIDYSILDGIDITGVKEVQLQDARNVNLGIFQVQDREYMDLTRKLKLVV